MPPAVPLTAAGCYDIATNDQYAMFIAFDVVFNDDFTTLLFSKEPGFFYFLLIR
jgi:hypothetical protein